MSAENHKDTANNGSSLYPIAVLIDELRCEDQKKRLNSIQNMQTICIALGPERCRNELMPYILELLEDDEEILCALATALGQCLEYVGGPAQAEHLFRVLERLCNIEEQTVREKATESIQKILSLIRVKDYESSLMQMMQRLNNDNNTSRYTAVNLVPSIFPYFGPQNQSELLEIFNKISTDSSPPIRKQAIMVLNKMIKLMPKVPDSDLMSLFGKIIQDEQDSVRMHGVECCVSFSQQLSQAKVLSQLNPHIKKLAEDKSWRIRYMLADSIISLGQAMGSDATKEHLLPHFASFLKDAESEVRTAALNKLPEFVKFLDSSLLQTKVVPSLPELQKDTFVYVRAALSEHMLSICPIIGKQATTQHILPIFLLLLRDENSEVRLNLFKRLEDLNQVVGIEDLQTSLLPSLEELSKEKNWRLKIQVIQQFPMLAKQLGEGFFNEKLSSFCNTWMKDPIYSVREAALHNYRDLTKIFGEQWALKHYIPTLFAMQTDISYLHRLTVLFGMAAMSEQISSDILKTKFMPMMVTMHKDPVANVRLNVAKSLSSFQNHFKQNKDIQMQACQILKTLQTDKDNDVKHYAERSLRQLN